METRLNANKKKDEYIMKAELQEMQMQPNGMMEGTADQEAGAAAIITTPRIKGQVQPEGKDIILPK